MEDTKVKYSEIKGGSVSDADALFQQAKDDMAADMRAREIGAVLWDNAQAGFHYPPAVLVTDPQGEKKTWVIHGVYRVEDRLYLIGPDAAVGVENYYHRGIEEKPVVVTLTEEQALAELGRPEPGRGYTAQGTVQEWLTVADCYFEALNLDNDL